MTTSALPTVTTPAKYAQMVREYKRTVRTAAAGIGDFEEVGKAYGAIVQWLHHTEEGAAYRAEVAAYNAAVAAHNARINARIKADRDRAKNARQVAATRAARCPSCFTVPSAAGACNC